MSVAVRHPVCGHLQDGCALSSVYASNTAPSTMLGKQKILANKYLLEWTESAVGYR